MKMLAHLSDQKFVYSADVYGYTLITNESALVTHLSEEVQLGSKKSNLSSSTYMKVLNNSLYFRDDW